MQNFIEIIRIHAARYPLMLPQDYGKLAYQSEFGPAHMITDEAAVASSILAEWQTVSPSIAPCNPEPIGNDLCRFHLTKDTCSADTAAILAGLFIRTATEHTGTDAGLQARLELLSRLPVNGMQAWIAEYRRRGCPPVHHSKTFRDAYHPHYRVVLESLANRLPVLPEI
jgi:hypothetical protein